LTARNTQSDARRWQLTGGYHPAFLIGFAMVVAAIVVAVAVLRSPAVEHEAPAMQPAFEGA
jgi:hypothetical protein